MDCRICGNDENNRHYSVKEMMLGLNDQHDYFECSACGCLQISQIPDNLAEYYPSDYYSYQAPSRQYGLKCRIINIRNHFAVSGQHLLGRAIHFVFPEHKLSMLRHIPLNYQSHILDVGCGSGHLLYALREIGYNYVMGVDPFNENDIEHDNGLIIKKQTLHETEGEWDLIMFNHSFEHLPDPYETLRKVFRLLSPGGTCLIRVPTVSSYAWTHYRTDWVQLDAPRHLYLHSIRSMQHLALQTGFTVEQTHYDSNALQFWGSKQYQAGISLIDERSAARNLKKSLFNKRDMKRFEKRAKELNAHQQGDQVGFYLKKPA